MCPPLGEDLEATKRTNHPSLLATFDDVALHRQQHPGPTCAVRRVLDTLSAKDRLDLKRALDGTTPKGKWYSTAVIARAMRIRGYTVLTDYVVARHRRGDCQCNEGGAPS